MKSNQKDVEESEEDKWTIRLKLQEVWIRKDSRNVKIILAVRISNCVDINLVFLYGEYQ